MCESWVYSQDNTFYRKYNLGGMQGGLQLATTLDGGFVATGQHEGNGSAGGCDIYVYRVDICGNIVWFKLYGQGSTDGGKSINQTSDGGFIVSGHYNGGEGFNLKIDADGNAQWLKTYSGMSWVMYSQEAANGDLLCLGHDGNSCILFRCNSQGDVIWSKYMSGIGNMGLYLKELGNGDIVLTSVQIGVGKDFYLTRVNSMGDVVWSKGYGLGWGDTDHTNWSNRGTVDEVNNVITLTCPTAAGGQGGENVLVAQLDLNNGILLWSKSYGGVGSDQSRDITPHPGGYAIVGNTDSYNTGVDVSNNITEPLSERDILLFDIDIQGNLQWSRTYGGSERDRGIGVKYNSDNGFTIAAFTTSPYFGNFDDSFDPLFMKTESDGWVSCQMHSPSLSVADVSLTETVTGSSSAFSVSASVPSYVVSDYSPQDNYVCQSCSTVPIFEPSDTMVCAGEQIQFINTTQIGLTCFQQWYVEGQAYNGGSDLTYVFDTPGDYTVELYSTCGGSSNTYEITIHVYEIGSSYTTSDYNGYDITCHGESDGYIHVLGTGGYLGSNPNYTITWTDGSSGFYRSNLGAGTYSYTLTDSIGCSFSEDIQIIEPAALTMDVGSIHNYNGFDISCYGLNDGGVVANVGGGVPPYNFGWINPAGNVQMYIENLPIGLYSCETTDANGCTISDDIQLIQPQEIVIEASVVSNFNGYGVSCFGAADGEIQTSATGGLQPYLYTINGNVNASGYYENLLSASYQIGVIDGNACQVSEQVLVLQPAELQAQISSTTNYNGYDVSCFGAFDGQALVNVTGGVPDYYYQWSDGAVISTSDQDLGVGVVTVEVTDINGCTTISSYTMDEPSALSVVSNVLTDYNGFGVSCLGASDGSISASPSGGVGGYQFSWNDGVYSSMNLTGVPANIYQLSVTDLNGCGPLYSSVIVTEPDSLTAILHITSNYNGYHVSCSNSADGSVVSNISGGVGPYQYDWSNSIDGFPNASALSEGIADLLVTDLNGCEISASIELFGPPPLVVEVNSSSNFNGFGTSCFDSQDGLLTAAASGGVPVYNYLWANGQIGPVNANLNAGNYPVQVLDANGCQANAIGNISSPLPITAQIFNQTNFNGYQVSCFGEADGSVELSASGGIGPYYFLWPDGVLGNIHNNLTAGSYNVSVVDLNECDQVVNVIVSEPALLSLSIVNVSDYNGYEISCYNQNDGYIQTQVSGGVAPFQYMWNTGMSMSPQLSNVPAGNYGLTVVDDNGCVSNGESQMLEQPLPIEANVSVISNYNGAQISCYGMNDGQAEIAFSGGVSPYYPFWEDGSLQFESNVNLSAGIHQVNYSDHNGCLGVVEFQLIQPLPVLAEIQSLSDYNGYEISCFGYNDGAAFVSCSGGTGLFTALWDDGQVGYYNQSLSNGVYHAYCTDINGCVNNDQVQLDEPLPLNINLQIVSDYNGWDVSCYGLADGQALANVIGGVAPYNYFWEDGSTIMNSNLDLSAGIYSVQIYDINGCFIEDSIELFQPSPIINSFQISDYSGYGISCFGGADGFIDVSVQGGVSPFNYEWSSGQFSQDLFGMPSGVYSVEISDANGCPSQFDLVELTQPTAITMETVMTSNYNGYNVSCYGASDGFAEVLVFGGVPDYNVQWDNGDQGLFADELFAGAHVVSVTDANGCIDLEQLNLDQPSPIQLSFTSNPDTCFLGFGSALVSVNGGVGDYVYLWENGSMLPHSCCLISGENVLVTVRDDNFCEGSVSVGVANVPPPSVSLQIESGFPICEDSSEVVLFANSLDDNVFWSWYFNDSKELVESDVYPVVFREPGDVTIDLVGQYANGCSTMVTEFIEVEPLASLYVPNAFTPDDDYINDGFVLRGTQLLTFRIKIFDRWGQLYFESDDIRKSWNGTLNNSMENAKSDVYMYRVEATGVCGEEIKKVGHVILLR
jgi:gliding motility-associated-like protein